MTGPRPAQRNRSDALDAQGEVVRSCELSSPTPRQSMARGALRAASWASRRSCLEAGPSHAHVSWYRELSSGYGRSALMCLDPRGDLWSATTGNARVASGPSSARDRAPSYAPDVGEYAVQQVDADELDLVRRLFGGDRATRHCWCTAFCSTTWQFAAGWYGGGNRRRFEELAGSGQAPMGVLAVTKGEPVGWCACGPRTRYLAAMAGRSGLLAERPRREDQDVWLVACIFVRPDHRGSGVPGHLVRGAVSLARDHGASAVEAWPLAGGVRRPGSLHVGREGAFARLGFRCIQRPTAERAIMRLDLGDERTS